MFNSSTLKIWGRLPSWTSTHHLDTWRIIPVGKELVTPIYKPFRPINHLLNGMIFFKYSQFKDVRLRRCSRMSTFQRDQVERPISSWNHHFSGKKHVLVFRWVDTGGSLLKVLETTGGYDVEAFLPSTGEKANGNR